VAEKEVRESGGKRRVEFAFSAADHVSSRESTVAQTNACACR
jgi:hypothetical protein